MVRIKLISRNGRVHRMCTHQDRNRRIHLNTNRWFYFPMYLRNLNSGSLRNNISFIFLKLSRIGLLLKLTVAWNTGIFWFYSSFNHLNHLMIRFSALDLISIPTSAFSLLRQSLLADHHLFEDGSRLYHWACYPYWIPALTYW